MIPTLLAVTVAGVGTPTPPPPMWGYDQHRIVCEIAWRELTPVAQREIGALLMLDPQQVTFTEACLWADLIRGDPRYERFAPAHYVNLPPGSAGVDVDRDCADICVVTAIRNFAAVLADRTRPPADRLEALKFLAHFVGDIHQPLHAGYQRDLGGNRTVTRFFGAEMNLHALWDYGMGERMGVPWFDLASRLHSDITAIDRRQWSSLDAVGWANESFRIVESEVYRDVQGEIGEQYLQRHWLTLERQMKKGGVRLGALLHQLLGEP